MTTRLALVGADGRMGQRIDALAIDDDAVHVAARITAKNSSESARISTIDVIIDFSSEEGTRNAISIARATGAALLVGTTGLSREVDGALRELAKISAVLIAPNTSLGVAVTKRLARLAAELLGPSGWSVDIIESHHDRKKDAPSGTALALARALVDGGMSLENRQIHAIRAGDTIGEHEIRFAGPSERIHIMHQAVTRDLFAAGALRGAKWLAGKPAGLYTMEDILG
ncbi:MAG: 4-hydroxy-tetrahydrodipicolinate reductase [Planctomycetota bacterium]|nr:MAG: 4-hydroxy-tetrahydrodipicolinate reductase [Planctomycetota bacterium]RLS95346.1 MAG: 4-hydroxy-tetrahydrodipicolinate reductase [Planctomycetota bacterium]